MTDENENIQSNPFLDGELDWTEIQLAKLHRQEAPKDRTSPLRQVTTPGLSEAIEALRKKGKVPLGVIAYDIENESVTLLLFPDVKDMEEANALLAQIGVKVNVDETP